MKKSEPPHIMEVSAKISDASLAGKCSCVAGIGGYCHHVIGLLYYLALLKQLGHCCLLDELTCTSMKQRWSVPRGRKIEQKEIQDVLVNKPHMGAQYSKFIKSTFYSPATRYGTWTKNHFSHYTPQPFIATLVPSKEQMKNVPFVPCRCGNVPKGCALSYQQRMSTDYVINDFTCTAFQNCHCTIQRKGLKTIVQSVWIISNKLHLKHFPSPERHLLKFKNRP